VLAIDIAATSFCLHASPIQFCALALIASDPPISICYANDTTQPAHSVTVPIEGLGPGDAITNAVFTDKDGVSDATITRSGSNVVITFPTGFGTNDFFCISVNTTSSTQGFGKASWFGAAGNLLPGGPTVIPAPVPEPVTLTLTVTGIVLLLFAGSVTRSSRDL